MDRRFGLESRDASAKSLECIASLALHDIVRVQSSRKGKALDSAPLIDEEFAFQHFAEANSLLVMSRDAILAGSIDMALQTSRALLRAYVNVEAQA